MMRCGCYYGRHHFRHEDFFDMDGGYYECPKCGNVFLFDDEPPLEEPYATGKNIDFAEELSFIRRERGEDNENYQAEC